MHDLRYRLCAGHTTAVGSQSVRGIFGLLLDDLGQAYGCKVCVKRALKGGMGQITGQNSASGQLLTEA